MMHYFKNNYNKSEFKNRELMFNFYCGLLAGTVAAALTNPLEVITVNKQTGRKSFSVAKFVQQ